MGYNPLAQMQLVFICLIGAWGLLGVSLAVTLVPSRWPHLMQIVLTSVFLVLIIVGYTATEHKSLVRARWCFYGLAAVEFVAVIFLFLTVLFRSSDGGVFGGEGEPGLGSASADDDDAVSLSGSGSGESYRDYSNTVLLNTQGVNVFFGFVATLASYRGMRYLKAQAALAADPHGHGHGPGGVGGHVEHAVRVPGEELPAPSDQTILFQQL